MRRRQALKIAAAAATLPLTGCGADAPKPPTTPETAQATASTKPATPPPDPPAQPSATAEAEAKPPAPEPTPEPTPKPPEYTRVICRIGKNHGHVFVVTLAEIMAGAEKTYQLAGSSNHPHAVTLTTDDMKKLQKGELLRAVSTQGLTHKHRVHVRCAPAEDPPDWIPVCTAEFTGKDEHELIITAADMAAEKDKTYEVQGLAGHSHSVTITTADFQKLKKEGGISFQTSRLEEDAHNHVVIIRNKPPKPA